MDEFIVKADGNEVKKVEWFWQALVTANNAHNMGMDNINIVQIRSGWVIPYSQLLKSGNLTYK